MKLTESVAVVGGGSFGLSHVTDANVYLVDGGRGRVLIDSGSGLGWCMIARNLAALGVAPESLDWIINTHSHWDHARGNAAFQQRWGTKVAAHPAAREILSQNLWRGHVSESRGYPGRLSEVTLELQDGQTFDLGDVQLEVMFTPGHTPDSVCIGLEESDRRVLFTGDTLSGEASVGVHSGLEGFEQFNATIDRMRAYAPDAIMPGHRAFALRNAAAYLEVASQSLRPLMEDYVPGATPFYPTWWLLEHPEIVADQACPDLDD